MQTQPMHSGLHGAAPRRGAEVQLVNEPRAENAAAGIRPGSWPIEKKYRKSATSPFTSPFTVVVTLSANPAYTLGSPSSATVTITSDDLPTLTVTKAGTGSGTVTSTPPGITCGTDCTESYAYGTSVTLTATPATGSTFAGWSGACTGTSPTCTVSMTQARSVTAVFTGPIPTLALSVNQPSFRRGETLTLGVTVTPGATSQVVDAYVAIALPGGPLLFLQGDGNFTTDVRPIVTNWTAVPFSGEIFRYTFSGGEPPGSYTWYAAFTVPGGNPLFGTIGPIVSAPFSFSP